MVSNTYSKDVLRSGQVLILVLDLKYRQVVLQKLAASSGFIQFAEPTRTGTSGDVFCTTKYLAIRILLALAFGLISNKSTQTQY